MFSRIRESLRESIVNSDIEIDDKNDDEILLTITSAESELKHMMRGQSFENERGCDEIM